jgi:hypothetical protein
MGGSRFLQLSPSFFALDIVLDRLAHARYPRSMAPKPYYWRWSVYLRGERIGEVLAATEQAACLRAIQRFKIRDEDRRELEVRRYQQSNADCH